MRQYYALALLAAFLSHIPLSSGHAICSSSDLAQCKSLPACEVGTDGSFTTPCLQYKSAGSEARGIRLPNTPSTSPQKDPFRDPSSSPDTPSNPFRDPSSSPDITTGIPAASWQNIADGNQLKFDNSALESHRTKGAGYKTDLDNAIKNNGGNGGSQKTLDEAGYTGQGSVTGQKPTSEKYLADFPIDVSKVWRGDNIQLKTGSDPILEDFVDGQQGVIFVKNSKGKDADPTPQLPWSSLVMSNWRAAGNVKGLKYMVRDNIQPIKTTTKDGVTLDTQDAIRASFQKMGADKKETLTLNPLSTNPAEVASFQLMAAQTHVSRVYFMLKDYRTELGDLTITKLHLFTSEHKSRSYEYSLLIEFGKGTA